jgi:hypothetical protein
MKAVFIELPASERHRGDYLDDDSFTQLQGAALKDRVKDELRLRKRS